MKDNRIEDVVDTRLNNIRKRLAGSISQALDKQAISQREICQRCEISQCTLSEIMNQKTNPKIETLVRIEAALGMNLFDIHASPKNFEY